MQRKMLPIEARALYEFATKGQFDSIVKTGVGTENMVDILKGFEAKAGRVIAYSVTRVVATGAKSEIDLQVTRTSGKYTERIIAMGTVCDWSPDESPIPVP